MREWLVASGIVEGPDGLLLVQNRRRNGSLDWSTPGGVIEVADGETIIDGLTREVQEETGVVVRAWTGPVYEVEVDAAGLGWHLRVQVHQAREFDLDRGLVVDDLDGIVVDACFVPAPECPPRLEACPRWVREPLLAWLDERPPPAAPARRWSYRVDGAQRERISVTLL